MQIRYKIDPAQLLTKLRNGEKRFAYAVVNAINATAKDVQKAEQAQISKSFTLRKREFMKRMAAVIKPFASVGQQRAFAEVSVGQKPRLLLSIFERGGERKPATEGARYVPVPVRGGPARPTWRSPVPTPWRMSRLKFKRTARGQPSAVSRRTRTYLIPALGIFQRVGSGARPVYLFTRHKKLRPTLHWMRTAVTTANKQFKRNLEREVTEALTRAGLVR